MIQFDVQKYDEILARGLSNGLGKVGGQVCIEAAICEVLGLGHSDDPKCVASAVRIYKIIINDSCWSNPQARAKGLRDLGIAQLGSFGVVDNSEFAKRISEKTIRVLIPKLFRELFPDELNCLAAAKRCEDDGTVAAAAYAAHAAARAAAYAAAHAANNAAARAANNAAASAANNNAAAYAAHAAARAAARAANNAAASAANNAAAAYAAHAAARAAAYAAAHAANNAAARSDSYLTLSANLALEVLRELKSPGCELLN